MIFAFTLLKVSVADTELNPFLHAARKKATEEAWSESCHIHVCLGSGGLVLGGMRFNRLMKKHKREKYASVEENTPKMLSLPIIQWACVCVKAQSEDY